MRVLFANGTEDQKALVRDAIPSAIALSVPHTVTVEFVATPGGSKDYFAYTTSVGGVATVQFDTVFPNYPAPFDGEAFARETVAHEFGHILQSYLSTADHAAISALMFPPGGPWETEAWEGSVEEADAETIKDTVTAAGVSRRYTNRTNFLLPASNFEDWLSVHNEGLRPADGSKGGSWQVAHLDNTVTFEETDQEVPGSGGNIAHESVWTWQGAYDGFFGAYQSEGGALPWRWRWLNAPDPDHIPLLKQRLKHSFAGAPLAGPQTDAPQDAITTDWTESGMILDTTHGSYEDMLFATVGDNPAELPWLWEFTLVLSYTQHPDDPPPPVLEFEVLDPLVWWEPSGLFGEWAFPPAPGPPPPRFRRPRKPLFSATAPPGVRLSLRQQVGIAALGVEFARARADR